MKPFTSIDLKTLIQHNEYPCISIYLPTHITGRSVRQDPIRLKNLLNDCQAKLESEHSQKKVCKLLEPGFDLLSNSLFWGHQSQGLALFISPSFSQCFHLTLMPDEKSYLGKCFYIMPLIPAILRDKAYYILVLSQKLISFFQADCNDINEIELYNVPKKIDDILKYDVAEEHIQMHTTPFGKSAGTNAVFHGQGNIADDARRKKNIERYLKKIAKGVDNQLQGQTVPLVLAGVEYEQAMFRQCSSYKNLLKEGIISEFGQIDVQELHHQAQAILEPHFNRDIEECLSKYQNFVNTKMTSTDIKEIVPAAYTGRIDTLLVDIDKYISGTFEPESQQININESNETTDEEDLLNLATIYSLKSDAKICPITSEKIGGPSAAVFRY